MESKYDREPLRTKLRASFSYVAFWAEKQAQKKETLILSEHFPEIISAARCLSAVVSGNNPGRAFRVGGVANRDRILLFSALVTELGAMPLDDPNRCDPQLRTALRRIEEFTEIEGYNFGSCKYYFRTESETSPKTGP